MDDFEKLNILAEWLESSSEPYITYSTDHVLATESEREKVCDDLRRMAKIMKWLSEEESPISPGDSMLDYYLDRRA